MNTWDSSLSPGSGNNLGEGIGSIDQFGGVSSFENVSIYNPLVVFREESEFDISSNNVLNNFHLFCEGICLSQIGPMNNSPTRELNRGEELRPTVEELNPNRHNFRVIDEVEDGSEEEYQSLDGYDTIDRCEDIAHEIVLRCLC